MFTFPSKERKLNWVDEAAGLGPIAQAGIELGAVGNTSSSTVNLLDNEQAVDTRGALYGESEVGKCVLSSASSCNSGNEDLNKISLNNSVEEEDRVQTDNVKNLEAGVSVVQSFGCCSVPFSGCISSSSVTTVVQVVPENFGICISEVNDGEEGGDDRSGGVGEDGNESAEEDAEFGDLGEQREREEAVEGLAVAVNSPTTEFPGCCPFSFSGCKDAVPVVSGIFTPRSSCNEELVILRPSLQLKSHYNMMFYLGVSTYKTWDKMDPLDWFWIVAIIVLKAFFWHVAIESLFFSICQAKFNFMSFLDGQVYTVFVKFTFHIASFCAKVYSINLLAFRHRPTDVMLMTMKRYELTYEQVLPASGRSWKIKLFTGMSILTWILAFATPLFAIGFSDWSVQKVILKNSVYVSEDVFMWNSATFKNATQDLGKEFGTNLTSTTVALGTIGLVRTYASYLVIGAMLDLVIVVGWVMYMYVCPFLTEVVAVTENVPRANAAAWANLQARREALWLQYRDMKQVFKQVNIVFGPLLKLMHLQNLLMYAFFLVLFIFTENKSLVVTLLYAYNTVKAEIAYFIAGKIAEANDIIRAWIRNWAMHTGTIQVGTEILDFNVILDELNKDPFGLGEGNSRIHQSFHYKLLGLASSIFFSMANDFG